MSSQRNFTFSRRLKVAALILGLASAAMSPLANARCQLEGYIVSAKVQKSQTVVILRTNQYRTWVYRGVIRTPRLESAALLALQGGTWVRVISNLASCPEPAENTTLRLGVIDVIEFGV